MHCQGAELIRTVVIMVLSKATINMLVKTANSIKLTLVVDCGWKVSCGPFAVLESSVIVRSVEMLRFSDSVVPD
jgi:hypothetical protein